MEAVERMVLIMARRYIKSVRYQNKNIKKKKEREREKDGDGEMSVENRKL